MAPKTCPLRLAAAVALAIGSVAAHADQPGNLEARKANRPEGAPEYQSQAPAASSERAAEVLNQRDQQKREKRKHEGDKTPDTPDGVRIESKPDHPGEHDGKP